MLKMFFSFEISEEKLSIKFDNKLIVFIFVFKSFILEILLYISSNNFIKFSVFSLFNKFSIMFLLYDKLYFNLRKMKIIIKEYL